MTCSILFDFVAVDDGVEVDAVDGNAVVVFSVVEVDAVVGKAPLVFIVVADAVAGVTSLVIFIGVVVTVGTTGGFFKRTKVI